MKKASEKEASWEEIGKIIGMKIEKESKDGTCKGWNFKDNMCCHGTGSPGAMYGLGFLGALFYYLTTATSIWMGLFGILKAIFWPAVLVYEVMKYLAM